MNKTETEWQTYRSRFLIEAKQLRGPLVFVDALGREHRGKKGDYLVESANGALRIWPRQLFEDAHVLMDVAGSSLTSVQADPPVLAATHRPKKKAVEEWLNRSVEKASAGRASHPLIA